jgi:hypothetical protein
VVWKQTTDIFFFLSLFYKRGREVILDGTKVASNGDVIKHKTIDVIIPDRWKKYLYDVLKDLAKQTLLPQKSLS